MSFHDWELSGGLDPHVEPEPEDETSPCGCGDPRCRIDGNDRTNVNIRGTWYAADCVGLGWCCSELDDLRNLIQISGYLFHEACVKSQAAVVEGLEQDARRDERGIK